MTPGLQDCSKKSDPCHLDVFAIPPVEEVLEAHPFQAWPLGVPRTAGKGLDTAVEGHIVAEGASHTGGHQASPWVASHMGVAGRTEVAHIPSALAACLCKGTSLQGT